MQMDPFKEKGPQPKDAYMDWKTIAGKPYDKHEVDPYTRTRVILMNGTEYEAVWFSHQFFRNCENNDLRRELAIVRRAEQQQQKRIAALKPADETLLEHTIGYEQLAVDLTARLAQCEPDQHVVEALNFALLEDFDHLYRYADLLEMEHGVLAEHLVGCYTEIMPGRPTIAEHRFPADDVKKAITRSADPITKLHVSIITAAEQQTMNYYMTTGAFYPTDIGRKLYTEIGMIEEQHVSQYGSLIETSCTPLENLLMHEYTECYLYYSMYQDETCPHIKKVWEHHFEMETGHLRNAVKLLEKYEKKDRQQVIPDGTFPTLLTLGPNKEYVRDVLNRTVGLTAKREGYIDASSLPENAEFFQYQKAVSPSVAQVASHNVIKQYISEKGQDYRYEEAPHPVQALRNRKKDNTSVGLG